MVLAGRSASLAVLVTVKSWETLTVRLVWAGKVGALAKTAPPTQPFQRIDGMYKSQRWNDGYSVHVILPDQKEHSPLDHVQLTSGLRKIIKRSVSRYPPAANEQRDEETC